MSQTKKSHQFQNRSENKKNQRIFFLNAICFFFLLKIICDVKLTSNSLRNIFLQQKKSPISKNTLTELVFFLLSLIKECYVRCQNWRQTFFCVSWQKKNKKKSVNSDLLFFPLKWSWCAKNSSLEHLKW